MSAPILNLSIKARIYLIDDDSSMQTSLNRMLRDSGYLVDSYSSGSDFLRVPSLAGPSVILLDMQLPDMLGVELQERLIKLGCNVPIIFLSGTSDQHQVVRGMKNGAKDFLFKPFDSGDLLKALDNAVEWNKAQIKQCRSSANIKKNYQSLTPKEREVCAWLVKGLSNKDIAIQVGRTDATIKVHKARVMRKMGAHSLQALVRMWLEAKLETC